MYFTLEFHSDEDTRCPLTFSLGSAYSLEEVHKYVAEAYREATIQLKIRGLEK